MTWLVAQTEESTGRAAKNGVVALDHDSIVQQLLVMVAVVQGYCSYAQARNFRPRSWLELGSSVHSHL